MKTKAEITLITHRCPKGHTWKSMMVKAVNCPTCRKGRVKEDEKGEMKQDAPDGVWRMRCHSCKDDYEANKGEWECPGCGSLCTEILETLPPAESHT